MTSLQRPSWQSLTDAASAVIKEFNPKQFSYLDSKGEWKQDPSAPVARITNELLFKLWKSGENQALLIKEFFSPLLREGFWPEIKKIKLALLAKAKRTATKLPEPRIDREIIQSCSEGGRSEKFFSLLTCLEVLAWGLHYEAVRLSANALVPDWEKEAKTWKGESLKELEALNNFLSLILDEKAREEFLLVALEKWKQSPELSSIPRIISEEERLTRAIESLLEEAKDLSRREDAYSLIAEKILPPMGIVTLASPSLLRPCLRLLTKEGIDISSGIQYNASVTLSILKDPRSTETLLKALTLFPADYSKIRENLIYTLGHLREKEAVGPAAQVLENAEETEPSGPDRQGKSSLLDQKKEALWALGKIGLESLPQLPTLVKYADHPSPKLRAYLAWALGEIGRAQKEKFGGVSADIVIALLKLLKTRNRQVFEEAVSAMRKIDLPEFTHSLYLYTIGAVSILGLKPAQKGLYELSETIYHLIQSKKRAVIAVNGDSGTGKTYFCQSIINGFGDIRAEEILYLMRDRKKDQKIFNRMLGLRWLKKHIDPVYYQDYPLSEEEDSPDEFFRQFLEQNSDKKLIILDGCRDKHYFQRVIDLFCFKAELDVEVNFRATLSTRRLNLEEREMALESVETHLSFLEEPSLEDTLFYQEGVVILYDLDNSISSRLSQEETRELFEKRRIESWGDLVRVGEFNQRQVELRVETEELSQRQENFSLKTEKWPESKVETFSAEERKFKAKLNEDPKSQPNLLQTIEMDDIKPKQVRFYAQDQVSGIGEEGKVFVLTFLDNRIFSTSVEKSSDIKLLGRDIYLTAESGSLIKISFERNEIVRFAKPDSPALCLASLARGWLITGHRDGSIRIWDSLNKNISVLSGHSQAVTSLAVDYSGGIYSGSLDRTLRYWDMERRAARIIENLDSTAGLIKLYPKGKILVISDESELVRGQKSSTQKMRIFNPKDEVFDVIQTHFKKSISSASVYFDGRVIAGLRDSNQNKQGGSGSLAIIIPGQVSWQYQILGGHSLETKDCLIMGPRIISCGEDVNANHSLRLWGTEFYVRMELGRLSLQK
jgi:WD40 repeat protein/HEAT repeat protein